MRFDVRGRRCYLIVAVILLGLLPAAFLTGQETVSLQSGRVKGVADDGVIAFKGIPYAAPPVGNLRWRAPQPPDKWTGVRSAANYGHDCMQLPFPGDAAPLGTPPSEDCLYMNVWAPAVRNKRPLPVMVWIYGGGFVNGGSSPAVYDGSQFARGNVVLVSFNYRLGRFGFFAHPALTRESPDGMLGNYGYMDQLAAMHWVQKNIAAFGGDPKNVMIFGESAGGGSVHALLASPLAAGLFSKAAIESGGGRKNLMGARYLHEAVGSKPSAEAVGLAFAESKGIKGSDADALQKLRALTADAIVDGLNMATMNQAAGTYPGPMIDGKLVVEDPQAVYLANKQAHIPVLVGANNMDIGFPQAKTIDELFALFGEKSSAARDAYDPGRTGNLRTLGLTIAADKLMVEPARFVAQTLSSDGQPVWEYRFSYVAASMRKEWSGAPHASEIPYVFDTVKARYGSATTNEDEKTAQLMQSYWLQFAKTGNPNGPGLPTWPRYSATQDVLMNFTLDGSAQEADRWKTRLDLTEALQQ